MDEISTKKRNGNIELLRMLSMCMVVMLHALGKGNLLVNPFEGGGVNSWIAWIIECLSIAAVNIFALISGYFLIKSEFKLKRLLELVCEIVFYSLVSFLVCTCFGINTGNELNVYNTLFAVFPVHMNLYWFMTSYIVVYMLQPLFKAGAEHLTKKQYKTMLILLVVFESVFKTVLPVRLEADGFGYNIFWFIIVFLIGGYFRYYGFEILTDSKKGCLLYFAAFVLVLAETVIIQAVISKTGHLTEISGVSLEYNHLFVLLEAIGIFAALLNKSEMSKKLSAVVCALSPMALGVYLFHENLSFRYNWQEWLGIKDTLSLPTGLFVVRLILAVLAVYVAGTVVDYVRILIFRAAGKVFAKRKQDG